MTQSNRLRDIKSDLQEAMKDRDNDKVATLRMLVSSLNNAEIDKGRELNDDEVVEVLSKEAKQRRESIEAYRDGGREELAEQEEAELELIQQYLPEPFSDEEVEAFVEDVIEETGAETMQDMGRVMGRVMPELKGRYDGSKAREIVEDKLG